MEKRDRKMYLLHKGKAVREYAVDLGADPEGPKEKEGDRKTPEGIYKISGRNPNSRYYLSLRISYPNRKDRERAEKAGVSPGGDIMIHGLPNISTIFGFRTKLKKDWTLGCIAVQTNEEMLEIWHLVKDGTIVEIKP
ncbi:MAG: murein L,D-transpeptidase family protein [Alphaproteobacteria bacterium]